MNKKVTTLENTTINPFGSWFLFFCVILIGSNLRAPLIAVGSLISFIRDDLGISHALAGTITTLPLLAFAFLSPIVPRLAHRFGMEWAITFCLFFLTSGIVVRSLPGLTSLFAGTVLIGLAIAIGNVLLPAFVKINFPLRMGIMTGLYAVSMNVFGALASGLSVPLATVNGVGWRGALGAWSILSFVALIIWLPQLRKKNKAPKPIHSTHEKTKSMWRSPLAWQITLFMGLQSFVFYILATWLPEIAQFNGYSSSAAGWILSLLQFSIIPITFIIPIIAEKMKSQSLLAGGTGVLFLIGITGLILGKTSFIPISVIIMGIAIGSAFGLSMMFFTLRTTDGKQASEISGMAQSFGYLLAATGPVLFGALHDATNGWKAPLTMLLFAAVIIMIVGIGAGRNKVITDSPK